MQQHSCSLAFAAFLIPVLTSCISIRQRTAIDAREPSHPILTEEADGSDAEFSQEGEANWFSLEKEQKATFTLHAAHQCNRGSRRRPITSF